MYQLQLKTVLDLNKNQGKLKQTFAGILGSASFPKAQGGSYKLFLGIPVNSTWISATTAQLGRGRGGLREDRLGRAGNQTSGSSGGASACP